MKRVMLLSKWWKNLWKDICFHTETRTLDHMVFECCKCGKTNIHGYGWW